MTRPPAKQRTNHNKAQQRIAPQTTGRARHIEADKHQTGAGTRMEGEFDDAAENVGRHGAAAAAALASPWCLRWPCGRYTTTLPLQGVGVTGPRKRATASVAEAWLSPRSWPGCGERGTRRSSRRLATCRGHRSIHRWSSDSRAGKGGAEVRKQKSPTGRGRDYGRRRGPCKSEVVDFGRTDEVEGMRSSEVGGLDRQRER